MLTYFFKNFILNLYGLCDLSFRNIGFGVCARFPLGKTSAVLIVPWPMSRHFIVVLRHGLHVAILSALAIWQALVIRRAATNAESLLIRAFFIQFQPQE